MFLLACPSENDLLCSPYFATDMGPGYSRAYKPYLRKIEIFFFLKLTEHILKDNT